jgi:hypothetical protein
MFRRLVGSLRPVQAALVPGVARPLAKGTVRPQLPMLCSLMRTSATDAPSSAINGNPGGHAGKQGRPAHLELANLLDREVRQCRRDSSVIMPHHR